MLGMGNDGRYLGWPSRWLVAAGAAVCQWHLHLSRVGGTRASGKCHKKIPMLGFGHRLGSSDDLPEGFAGERCQLGLAGLVTSPVQFVSSKIGPAGYGCCKCLCGEGR